MTQTISGVAELEARADKLFQKGRLEDALNCALDALRLRPRSSGHRVAGDILQRMGELDESRTHYVKALDSDPDNFLALSNFGLLLTRTGDYTAALESFRRANALTPGDASVRQGLYYNLLILGHLREGWPYYAARHDSARSPLSFRPAAARMLEGPKVVAGAKILAWADQGIGEQIMFASMIPDLTSSGAKLTVEADSRLAKLLERSFPGIETIPRRVPPDPRFYRDYDAQVCLGDTATWFRPDESSFPQHRGYLKCDARLSETLRQRYRGGRDNLLVGISWRTSHDAKVSRQKTLELAHWGPLLCVPGLTFVNLQYGDCASEITASAEKFGVRIIHDRDVDPLLDLDPFAAQVAAVDLVITTSNATAHMAGALGKPVWTLTPKGHGAMWYWLAEGEKTPWYPSMRILRQQQCSDWEPVLGRCSEMLVAHATGEPNPE